MTGRRSTFVPSVPSQEHIEEAARLFKSGSAYADSDDLDVRKDYDPGQANMTAAVVVVAGLLGLVALLAYGILSVAVHL